MANRLPKAGIRQPKTIVRECNALLAGSGMVVRDWQPISDLHELHQQLQQDAAKKAQATPPT